MYLTILHVGSQNSHYVVKKLFISSCISVNTACREQAIIYWLIVIQFNNTVFIPQWAVPSDGLIRKIIFKTIIIKNNNKKQRVYHHITQLIHLKLLPANKQPLHRNARQIWKLHACRQKHFNSVGIICQRINYVNYRENGSQQHYISRTGGIRLLAVVILVKDMVKTSERRLVFEVGGKSSQY